MQAPPTFDDARRLAEWRPDAGVVSVYLRFDPGDRSRAWQTELRNALAAVVEAGEGLDRGARTALRATAKRLGEHFVNHDLSLPRGEAGFVEVAEDAGEEHWWATHVSPAVAAGACYAERPVIAPLLCLAEHGAPRGVALVSSERVRLLEWAPGAVEDLHSWELSLFTEDWREHKAPRVDPVHGQRVGSAGRDQYDERLEENRDRFLGECGRLAARAGEERAWPELIVFGAPDQARAFRAAASASPPVEIGGEADLISVPDDGRLDARIEAAVAALDGARHRALAERVLEEARGGVRGTAGAQETLAALEEGRVERLLLDAAAAAAACSDPLPAGNGARSPEPGCEELARRALAGGATVATVSGEAAELLAPVGGVAALLRY